MAKVMTTLLFAILVTGCFQAQRALGCNNTGIFGCKDDPSEIPAPDPELRRAPSEVRALSPGQEKQVPEFATRRYLEGHEYPWSQPLDDCMAAGGLRTECIENLPPDILAQFEAWEAKRGTTRRRQFQQRRQPENSPLLGVESSDSHTGE